MTENFSILQPLRGEINYPYRYFSFIYFSIHPFFFFYLFFISLIISEQWIMLQYNVSYFCNPMVLLHLIVFCLLLNLMIIIYQLQIISMDEQGLRQRITQTITLQPMSRPGKARYSNRTKSIKTTVLLQVKVVLKACNRHRQILIKNLTQSSPAKIKLNLLNSKIRQS